MKYDGDMIKACNVAARWWAEHLGTGIWQSNNNEVNYCEKKRSPSKNERLNFCHFLNEELIEMMKMSDIICLSSDYSPIGVLEDIADECEILDVSFPNEAIMCISALQVAVYHRSKKAKTVLFDSHNKNTENDLSL